MAAIVAARRDELGIVAAQAAPQRPIDRLLGRMLDEVKAEQAAAPQRPSVDVQAERRRVEQSRREGLWRDLSSDRGFGRRYADCRIESFDAASEVQAKVVDALRSYCSDPAARMRDGVGLMFLGPKGTGKDHLLVAAAHEFVMRAGVDFAWKNGEDFWGDIRDAMDESKATERAFADRMCKPSVLALSDPLHVGVDALTSHQANVLFRILDRRYRDLKPTWVTLNVSDRKEAEARMGPQIVDRLAGSSLVLKCAWPSYRKSLVF